MLTSDILARQIARLRGTGADDAALSRLALWSFLMNDDGDMLVDALRTYEVLQSMAIESSSVLVTSAGINSQWSVYNARRGPFTGESLAAACASSHAALRRRLRKMRKLRGAHADES